MTLQQAAWSMKLLQPLFRRGLPAALTLLLAMPAVAYVNEIEIMVARGRLVQCGAGWDPQRTGRWSGGTGSILVDGRKLHEFNLADEDECDRVVKARVEADANQRIEVMIVNQGGANRMAASLTTVAAHRVWRVEYFADQAWGSVVSTDWPQEKPSRPAAGGFSNDIRIRVARDRLWQCGGGWDPQRTGRWSGGTGSIFVDGRKLHEFNLANQAECERVVSARVTAAPNQRIEVVVVNQGGANRMTATLTAVAADRVWQVEYFSDQTWGSVISTDWPDTSGAGKQREPPAKTPAVPPGTGQPQRGYQLYFDGKLVSGPDAEFYSRQQALDNCAWNRRTKPHIRIDCVHDGQTLRP